MKPLHDGHRRRMYARFLAHGLDGFSKHEVVEIMLYPLLPRGNTNEVAHRLINELGNLPDILDAPIERLEAIQGIGRTSAINLRFLGEVVRSYMRDSVKQGTPVETIEQAAMMLAGFARGKQCECVFVLSTDAKNRLLGIEEIMKGGRSAAPFEPADVVETAKRNGASSVIIAHNHTSGNAVPSAEDVAATVRARQLLNELHIRLADHLILADDDFVSLRESGYIS